MTNIIENTCFDLVCKVICLITVLFEIFPLTRFSWDFILTSFKSFKWRTSHHPQFCFSFCVTGFAYLLWCPCGWVDAFCMGWNWCSPIKFRWNVSAFPISYFWFLIIQSNNLGGFNRIKESLDFIFLWLNTCQFP